MIDLKSIPDTQKELLREYPVKDLIAYERNPRKNEEAVQQVIQSMQKTGINDPIEINEQGVMLCGHTRKLALMEMGVETVDVLQISGLTEEQQKEYRVLNNKTGEFAEWDFDILHQEFELEELKEMGFDFNLGNIDKIEKVNSTDTEWVGMPEFQVSEKQLSLNIYFDNEQDRIDFLQKYPLKIQGKKQSALITWWPYRDRQDLKSLKYE